MIAEPRSIGKSEGKGQRPSSMWVPPSDTYDLLEWMAKQPWCDGKVGMTGSCGFAGSQVELAESPPPALKGITPFLTLYHKGDYGWTGIFDCKMNSVLGGRHGNDSAPVPENTRTAPTMFALGKEELEARIEEAFNHPDIRYNSKWYSLLKYPWRSPIVFDALLESFHPKPLPPPKFPGITTPTYLSSSGIVPTHTWCAFELFERIESKHKKLMLWPNLSPDRPQKQFADEVVRWFDYWIKGIDTGIMDEPPLKIFVNGVDKWRFENEWPLARTEYVKLYLHPRGGLSTEEVKGAHEPDSFTQPAPYVDPTVYCLTYTTGPLPHDVDITGYIALYLHASIDKDETNWMVDLMDVDPEGKRRLVSGGSLAAEHRALDEDKSKPYLPIHPRKDPVAVTPGEITEYAIAIMPTSMIFKKGHSIELVVRNQDDLLSRLGAWGAHYLPHMQTVTHGIHFGKSHLLLPVIPPTGQE